MLDQGWIEETHRLRSQYPRARALQAVGYRQILNYLDQIIPPGRKVQPGEAGLLDEICLATRQLVKAQRTFYKGLQKRSPESILPAPTQLDS
jgi:tRNA A37 N6-isopentenylltransferase MiaA